MAQHRPGRDLGEFELVFEGSSRATPSTCWRETGRVRWSRRSGRSWSGRIEMSPGVLGAVVNAQSGELTALLGGGAPDEAAVVDPVSLPIPPRRDRRPLSGSVSAADIIALAQD